MVYQSKFVACVKNNGKILREDGDTVFIPLKSEYSILLKNLNSKRAKVSISIDGKSIGSDLIVDANSEVEIERFIDGDLDKGSKFRFIEKTQEISEFRGDRSDDGLIRIEYWYEKPYVIPTPVINYDRRYKKSFVDPITPSPWSQPYNDITWNMNNSVGDGNIAQYYCNNISYSNEHHILADISSHVTRGMGSKSLDGITVKGSDSNQKFVNGYIGALEYPSEVIVLRLRGVNEDNKPIAKPITVQTKLQCSSCGRKYDSNLKFCSNCGTRLVK